MERQKTRRVRVRYVAPASLRDQFSKDGCCMNKHQGCIFGVSLDNAAYRPDKLAAYARWINERFERCVILLGDYIHRHTLRIHDQSLSESDAAAKAHQIAQFFIEEHHELFAQQGINCQFEFRFLSQVVRSPEYSGLFEQIGRLEESDSKFHASVQQFAEAFVARRNLVEGQRQHLQDIRRSSCYLLEELAVFSCLQQECSVLVYPGNFSVLKEIAEGCHSGVPEKLKQMILVSLDS